MAHELDFSTGRAAMAYVGAKPWHHLGNQLTPGATIEDWQTAAGMDWKVLRSRIHFATSCNPEEVTVWDDMNVLFRSDTNAPLGVVSKRYQIVQPKTVLEFFRDLSESMGFTLETAGCLFDGKRFWALAKVSKDASLLDPNDKVGGYLLFSTSADGTLATTLRFTMIRVVCNNTLSVAIGGKSHYSLTHHAEFNADTAKDALGIKRETVVAGFESSMDMLRKLASTPWSIATTGEATMRLFGHNLDKMTGEQVAKATKSKPLASIGQMAVTGAGLLGAEMKGGHGTAWGWLNAVTQYVDHEAKSKNLDRRIDSAWFGPGDDKKREALKIATEMADA